jgi:LAGLIDADG-like domain
VSAPPTGWSTHRHFWRGVVDGDGWISKERRVIGLVTASAVLRDQFVGFLGKAIGCAPTLNDRNRGALYQLQLTGSNAAGLASLLYAESIFALPRKRAAALLVIEGDRNLRARAEKIAGSKPTHHRCIHSRLLRVRDRYPRGHLSGHTVYYVLDRASVTRRPREWDAAQKQHCSKGHLFDESNIRIEKTVLADVEPAPGTAAVPGPKSSEISALSTSKSRFYRRRMRP